jgi:hypothetical protein
LKEVLKGGKGGVRVEIEEAKKEEVILETWMYHLSHIEAIYG